MKRTGLSQVLAGALLFGITIWSPANLPTLEASDAQWTTWLPVVLKNRTPYPEWTLEQQLAGMEIIEEVRGQERIEDLRDTLPPAEWIASAYHGLILDANYDVIVWT